MDFEADLDTVLPSTSTTSNQDPSTSSAAHSQPHLRSSARVRAAREKETERRQQQATQHQPTNKADKGKGRASQPVKPRRSNTSALRIEEPVTDRKGKKRAAPREEEYSDDDLHSETQPPPPKRLRTSLSSYSLRTRNQQSSKQKVMSKKPRTKNAKASTSRSGPIEDDVEMGESSDIQHEKSLIDHSGSDDEANAITIDAVEEDRNLGGEPSTAMITDEVQQPPAEPSSSTDTIPPAPPPAEPTFGSLMGSDFQFGAYMASIGSRLKTLLTNIKPSADPTTRLLALQDLSEILSMSTEDNLSGYFSQDSFVKELVHIMGGPRKNDEDGSEEGREEAEETPENEDDAALAAALAMSGGGMMGEENLEEQLLACRCLANLMEAMPGSAHTLVYHGAVPVLCSKLLEIQFIDLAEQTISTLEKLSEEYPSAIVREGGLAALLNYLDFFSTHVQRTALQAAANCCRNMSSDSFNMIRDVFPTIRNVLAYSDTRLVEYASMCVIRTIESFSRSQTESLEQLITEDLVRSINVLLLPQSGTTPIISANTSTLFLRALSGAAKSSPVIALTLLEANIDNTLYSFLTGTLPPNNIETLQDEQGGGDGQGVGSGLADMAVMQNLAHRPKDQVEEALSLISELLPPLPRDGVFDPRGYTEKSVSRAIKSKMKEAKASSRPETVQDPTATTSAPTSDVAASFSNAEGFAALPNASDFDGLLAGADDPSADSAPEGMAPHEAEIAAMLLVPESELATPANEPNTGEPQEEFNIVLPIVDPIIIIANDAPAPILPFTEQNEETNEPERDVEMATGEANTGVDAPAAVEAEANVPENTAPTNMETESAPLSIVTNEEGGNLVASPVPVQEEAPAAAESESVPVLPIPIAVLDGAPAEIPPEVMAAIASGSSSSRHRQDSSQARLKLLRDKPGVVSRFLYLIVPILFDVYSASVTLQVRMRCFTGILKATSFVDGIELENLYRKVPVASFIGSILTSRDNPLLVTNALQLVEILLIKSSSVFKNSLRKEGVLHEVSTISKIELKIKAKPPPPPTPAPNENPTGENGSGEPGNNELPPPPIPTPPRKSSSVPSDPQDAYVLRSRLIKVKYLTGGSDANGDPAFDSLRNMIKSLADVNADEDEIQNTLKDIAKLFGNTGSTISSFELLKSGLVEGLLEFATSSGGKVDVEKRKDMFLSAFSARSGYATPSSQTPLSVLVKRLQESLTRMESFDVVTTSPGSMDDAKRSSMALISRTLRLKLVAEESSDVPKSCQNLMVSIHAIAPFSALDDYLKPRIAGTLPFRPDMSSGFLQALAGSGIPPSALAQSVLARLTSRPGPGSSGSSASAAGTLGSLLSVMAAGSPTSGSSTPVGTGTSANTATSTSLPIPIPTRRRTTGSGIGNPASNSLESAEPSTSEGAGVSRRRSLRLRGQPPIIADPPPNDDALTEATSSSAPASTGTSNRTALASSLLNQLLIDDTNLQDEGGEENGDNDEEPEGEPAFNLAFDGADGRLTASTPHGTRIATPLTGTTPRVETPIGIAAAQAEKGLPRPSYASAALAAVDKAMDFHLEFRLNEEVLPMDMTVYGAFHQHEARRSSDGQPNPHAVWNGNYTITYRKIPGKRPAQETAKEEVTMETDVVAGLAADSPSSKILRLLRVLYRINAEGIEHLDSGIRIVTIPDAAFINNKLTAKLARQLEEIMILASNCLPDWALDLPQSFGFLFPFSTRYLFLQSTSFGYARLLNRVISQTTREGNNNNRRDGLDQYGRLQRRKVEVPRDSPMQVALKVFDLFGASSSILDVHFQGEVGTGLGPTLEFFASVCREFAWRDLKLWRDADSTLSGKYVHHPLGLFPAPMLNEVVEGPNATERDRRKVRLYRLLGQFVARALLDSRIIDISFNKIFLKFILGEDVPLSVNSVKVIDPGLGHSLSTLQTFVKMKRTIESDGSLNEGEKAAKISAIEVNGVTLEDMCLDFTVPGYEDLELKSSGKDINVTINNVEEYVELVVDAILGRGSRPAVKAFKEGFSTVFPVADLRTFSVEELVMMFGNADEDWSTETLNEAIKADHGFNVESKPIRDLISIMTNYDKTGRRDFLQFITGSPKLPIGGFKALNPQLTVVRKPHEAPLTPDDYLPSVMTCAHYLKLPSYSSRATMEKQLLIAMREGTGSFHLS